MYGSAAAQSFLDGPSCLLHLDERGQLNYHTVNIFFSTAVVANTPLSGRGVTSHKFLFNICSLMEHVFLFP